MLNEEKVLSMVFMKLIPSMVQTPYWVSVAHSLLFYRWQRDSICGFFFFWDAMFSKDVGVSNCCVVVW